MRYGKTSVIPVTPVVDAVAYSAGDAVGGLNQVGPLPSVGACGILKDVVVTDAANQKAALTLLFLDSLPTGTFTNNGPVALSAADLKKVVAKVNVAAADYETVGGRAVAMVDASRVVRGDESLRTLWLLVVATGTPTYAVGDLQIRCGLLLD